MAKKARTDQDQAQPENGDMAAQTAPETPADTAAAAPPSAAGESHTTYFRRLFKKKPHLLDDRSNKPLMKRWLKDHPGETEVPHAVRTALANVKSDLRRQQRVMGGPPTEEEPAAAPPPVPVRVASPKLDLLEERIDGCLTLAREIDPDGLEEVIAFLRRARNGVVRKVGESR